MLRSLLMSGVGAIYAGGSLICVRWIILSDYGNDW